MNYLGSIESSLYKGNVVLCQAVRKIVTSKFKPKPHPTVLEISDKGIKIVDKTKIIVSKHLRFKVKCKNYKVARIKNTDSILNIQFLFISGIHHPMP